LISPTGLAGPRPDRQPMPSGREPGQSVRISVRHKLIITV